MLVGILYYRNISSEARRKRSDINLQCIHGIKNLKLKGGCRDRGVVRGYRKVKFDCIGGAKGELEARSCLSRDAFQQAAEESCRNMIRCTVSPTPTPEEPTPTPDCIERPICLDEDPACLIPEPAGGWCEVSPTEEPTLEPTLEPTIADEVLPSEEPFPTELPI